jgi:YebC/PmpR family DNA-binding regulatory protein
MSGHSKWSKVKHQKAVTDAVKGQAFTKASRAISIAVREGGGITDPEKNFRLRLALELARGVNMPKQTIERAIAKGSGGEGAAIESLVYEAYGPGGVAILISAATDNRQRTVSQVKNVVEKGGGSMASPGAVGFLFAKSGILTVHKEGRTLDSMLELGIVAGADDVVETEDLFEMYCDAAHLHTVREALLGQGIAVDNTQIIMKPTIPIDPDATIRARAETLVSQLEELEDVQHVYTNLL